jgi:shikimate dehydrogenase
MHNAALEAVGLTGWRYQLLPIAPELLDELVPALPDAGFRGANVTIPHKEGALRLAHQATARARAIGAANTLVFDERGAIQADNTDAPALIEVLPFAPTGVSALVLGAGGSARAVVWALLDAGARDVRVWNRNPERARSLTADVGGVAVDAAGPADVLVHCTPVGLDGRGSPFKELPLTADELRRYRCVVDLVYTETETVLARTARSRGIPTVDGLELLVAQGALSFELFTGVDAPREVMREAARGPR